MTRRLLPLNALRAFDATSRHMRLSGAAAELHVTPSAISHLIRRLEEDLGVPLFRRVSRRLVLTETGQRLAPGVQEAFARLVKSVDEVRGDAEGGTLTVSLRPHFAVKWLTPRLSRFWEAHPEVELRLHHTIRQVDFASQEADLAIEWGRGERPALECTLLVPGKLTPVCSPALLEGAHPLRTPADLRHHTLLRETDHDSWVEWLALAGEVENAPHHNLYIDDSNVRIQAAVDGQGVELGCIALITDDLAAGRLVMPFDLTLDAFSYYVVHPRRRTLSAKTEVFRRWLLDEARRDPEQPAPPSTLQGSS
jgi:LysR family glycine cleavage system transcriptional activator